MVGQRLSVEPWHTKVIILCLCVHDSKDSIKALQMNPEESHVLLIGDSENDPNVYSFVSQLLKQGRNYVSIINGGFNVCLKSNFISVIFNRKWIFFHLILAKLENLNHSKSGFSGIQIRLICICFLWIIFR